MRKLTMKERQRMKANDVRAARTFSLLPIVREFKRRLPLLGGVSGLRKRRG